jgi:hypothetical protein
MQDQADLIDLLTSLPENEAINTLSRLRATRNLARVLATLQGSMSGLQRPSINMVTRAFAPPTNSILEFELIERHSDIYAKLVPLQTESLTAQLGSKSQGAQLIYEAPMNIARETPSSEDIDFESTRDQKGLELSSTRPHSPLLDIGVALRSIGPSCARQYCDVRLKRLKIAFWTEINLSNEYAASVISFYLETIHPILATFDTELFLADLIDRRERFCSPFLVNALLYNALVSDEILHSDMRRCLG